MYPFCYKIASTKINQLLWTEICLSKVLSGPTFWTEIDLGLVLFGPSFMTPNLGRKVGIRPEIFLGVPQNFGRVCCFMGPQQLMFNCIFKKMISEIWDSCCLMGSSSSRKNLPKIRDIFGNFFKKSIFYASKWSQMDRFWRILMKWPIKRHTDRF